MLKPKLFNSALPSTAASKSLLSNTYVPLQTTSMKSTMREFHNPIVSSFYRGPSKREQPRVFQKQQPVLQKESKSSEENSWVDTSDIESVIKKRIETDVQLSMEPTLSTQKYLLGPERICTQKMLPIPFEIKQILKQKQQIDSQNKKVHLVYGYLRSLNAIYYIIEQLLYIFSIDDLKNRSEDNLQNVISPQRVYKPTKLRPDCRRIYESEYSLNKMIPRQFNGKALIFEYPFYIEICSYKVDNNKQIGNQNQNGKQRQFLTLINLNIKISLETISAEFITVTQKGQILYLDQYGRLVCFQFSKIDDSILQRKTHQQRIWKKKTFISKNNGFLKAAKTYFQNVFDFGYSPFLSKRKNLALIYDNKRNRVYTLTAHLDRTSIIQQVRKQIRVYEFVNSEQKVELNCLMSIGQQQLLRQIKIKVQKSKTFLFTILKAEPDYNRQSELIALLSNGAKAYFRFSPQTINLVWIQICPDLQSLNNSRKQRKQNLMEISRSFISRDQNNSIQRVLSEKFDINRSQNLDYKLKSYFNDRSLSIGIMRTKDQYSMYMTIARNLNNSNQFDVFPILWKNKDIFYNVQKFPTENEIFMVDSRLGKNVIDCQLNKLQRIHYEKHKIADQSFKKNLHPISDNCHQLLRQVHHSPKSFVYLSNKFITNFTLLRPIDILYMMIVSRDQIFCEMYLPSILGLEPYQICCMLLQLYTTKDAIYYNSKNYKRKMNLLFDTLRENTKKFQTLGEKTIVSTFSSSNQIRTGNKQIFQQKQQDQLELISLKKEDFEKLKSKLRQLFVSFSRLQQIKNPNAFERIKLRFDSSSMSTHIEDKIEKLNQEQKGQAKYCLLYISRVLYPFWRVKIVSNEVSRHTLSAVKEKITQLFSAVDLLKFQSNDYWSHLKIFLKKLIQIVQMCINISHLPSNLTLQDAVSKQPPYFEPYIFSTLRRETSPQMLRIFIDKFPLYISRYFEILIKILMEARLTVNVEQIKSMLGRLPQYPSYFLDFLKEEKGFNDVSFLKIRGQMVQSHTTRLNIPDLPFQNLIRYLHSKVTSTSVKISQKFLYLKESRKRLNSYRSSQLRQVQVFSPYVLQRLQKQYDDLFKCLKLQQECKKQIMRIAEQTSNENRPSQNEQNNGIFQKIKSKFSILLQKVPSKKQLNSKRLSLVTKNQDIQKIEYQNQYIFKKLNHVALSKEDLGQLIQQIGCPRLVILHCSMFSGRSINEIQNFRTTLYQNYCKIVADGIEKMKLNNFQEITQKQTFSQLVDFIKSEIKEIYLFLNTTKTPLAFTPIYQAIKRQMIKIDITLQFIIQNVQQCILSVGRELIELGFDKNIVLNHIIYDSIKRNFRQENFQRQDQFQFSIKNWIYDWYMGVDVAKSFKKQSLNQLYNLTKDVLQLNEQKLKQMDQYKKFLQKGLETIFNIINGNFENGKETKTIMERLINSIK